MAKGMLIVSYDLPADVDEGHAKLRRVADELRPHFQGEPDVKIHVAIHETADSVLAYLEEGG